MSTQPGKSGMGSPLDGLRARRDALVAEQVAELPVPVWTSPVIRLRIKPVDPTLIQRIYSRAANPKIPPSQRPEAELDANASVVYTATEVVLVGEGDGQAEVSLDDLAPSLDLPEGATGAQIVRALCIRGADVLALAQAVGKHSGYADELAAETLAGE